MAIPRLLYLGQDLYDLGYVEKIPVITETKGFGRNNLTPSNYTFDVRNDDDFFSINNSDSPLSNTQWQYKPIQYYNSDDILYANGIVDDIPRDHETKKAKIICKDAIFENRKTPIAYESATWETPATAAKNLMDQEGFEDYDTASLQASINRMTDAGCYVQVNINRSDNLTLFRALEKLGRYAVADVYMKLNKVHFDHYFEYSGGVSIDFNYNIGRLRPLTAPSVSSLEPQLYNDYSIGYDGDGGVPATDADNNDIGEASRRRYGTQAAPEMRSDSQHVQILYKDLTSAVYIGETYIRRGNINLSSNPQSVQQIKFSIDYIKYRKNVELGTYFSMTFGEESWTDKMFQVFTVNRDEDSNKINITGYEI